MENTKKIYTCENCNYSTPYNTHYYKHMHSRKHFNCINNLNKFICEHCNKEYKDKSGLWRHNRKQHPEDVNNYEIENTSLSELNPTIIFELIKQNASFQNLLLEQSKMMMSMAQNSMVQNNTCINNNSNNNSNNKTFNLQFFLNEQCKDAMTLQDFVNSLKIGVEDLEATGRLGFVEGISNIIVNGLNKLDIYKRPIHCTDLKREVMYVKIFKGWEKDADGKPIVAKTVRSVIDKNFSNLKAWQELNPQYDKIETKTHENYMNILCQCFPGSSIEDCDINMDKVIKNIAKKTVINKQEVMNDLNNPN